MMYEVIISKRAREMLLRHTLFLSYVSLPAAKILRQEFNAFNDIFRIGCPK